MMSDKNLQKKFKIPKEKTTNTTNPYPRPTQPKSRNVNRQEPQCPLLAKDSEWVDVVCADKAQTSRIAIPSGDEEKVLQLVDCEDGPEIKPLAIMFPGLLEKDPQTLQGVLDKVMSTTEVTRRLVELGQKANFSFMKKSNRLIPRDKQWLEKVTEDVNSIGSEDSDGSIASTPHEYEEGHEMRPKKPKRNLRKQIPFIIDSNPTLDLDSENPDPTSE